MKPINDAPSLNTTNGIGFQLYGNSDYDNATDSYISTYFFEFFHIPIFPIRKYRVRSLDGGYRFFGSLPLSVANKWHLFISVTLLASLIFYIVVISNESSGGSYTPPSFYRPSYCRHLLLQDHIDFQHPQLHGEGELDSDTSAIDREKAAAEQMAIQLKNLKQEIDHKQLFLNQESQSDIDRYNSKVDTYNNLLERTRSQNRLVNQLVENYNNKLRQYGR